MKSGNNSIQCIATMNWQLHMFGHHHEVTTEQWNDAQPNNHHARGGEVVKHCSFWSWLQWLARLICSKKHTPTIWSPVWHCDSFIGNINMYSCVDWTEIIITLNRFILNTSMNSKQTLNMKQQIDYWEYCPMSGLVGNQRWRPLIGSK